MSPGLFVQQLWILVFRAIASVWRLHPRVTVLKGMLRTHPDILLSAARTRDLLLTPSSTPVC